MEIQKVIRNFLENDPFYQESLTKDFEETFPLMDSGGLDSIGIFNLIIFLESRFSISISIEELAETNFSTLQAIAQFVQKKIDENA